MNDYIYVNVLNIWYRKMRIYNETNYNSKITYRIQGFSYTLNVFLSYYWVCSCYFLLAKERSKIWYKFDWSLQEEIVIPNEKFRLLFPADNFAEYTKTVLSHILLKTKTRYNWIVVQAVAKVIGTSGIQP